MIADRKNSRKAKTGGKGSGRLSASEQAIDDKLHAELKVARDEGCLPGETRQATKKIVERDQASLLASVRDTPQAHASTQALPRGPGTKFTPNDEDVDDSDEDDEELSSLNYYQCPPQQIKFNSVARRFFNEKQSTQQVFYPPDVLTSRCDPDLIGLVPCYVNAPHKSLGLPLPPCPKCGWKSVDDRMVTTNGVASGARRIFGSTTDAWLIGQSMICKLCEKTREVTYIL